MSEIDSSSWSEIKSLDERLARDPDSFCFARLSEIYLNVGLATDALHTARQGVAKHPGYLAGQRALAMACNANGLYEESLHFLESVTTAMPDDRSSQNLLANLYIEAGNKTAAIRVYNTLLDFSPDDAQSKSRLEEIQLSELGKPLQTEIPSETVDRDEEIAYEVEEEVYELSEDEIVYDEEHEEIESTEPHVSDVPPPDIHDPLSTITLAELYEQQGFNAKALDIYRTLLGDDPDNERLKVKISILESQDSTLLVTSKQDIIPDLSDFQEPIVSRVLDIDSPPLNSQIFSPLVNKAADNVLNTLDSWLENIRRIKACR